MHLCIIAATLLYLLHLLSTHKSLVYPPFVYILYDDCSEDLTEEYSSLKYYWHDRGDTLGVTAPLSREKSPFLK